MNYDNLYNKDYIKEPEDIHYLYCNVCYYKEDHDAWYELDLRTFFDCERDLMTCITGSMNENGFIMNSENVEHCIRTDRLGTFFEEVHLVFTLAGVKHLIEFKELG